MYKSKIILISLIIHIIISVFIGVCFVFLAKRYQKSQSIYFCIGFFTCLVLRMLYLIIYGLFTDFEANNDLDYHRNLSILFSIIISYILFRILKKRSKEKFLDYSDINEIGIKKE